MYFKTAGQVNTQQTLKAAYDRAEALKRFGQGTKVAVEVSIMAADAGYLSGRDIVAIGGSSRGADTALVLTPQNQAGFFDLKIREIICKPSHF